MAKTFGWTFYDEQIALIVADDTDALVERHYHADASLLRFDGVIRGHDALKLYFRTYIRSLGGLRVLSTDKFIETDDAIFLEATVQTGAFGVVRVYDTFVLEGGRATHHFTGVMGPKERS